MACGLSVTGMIIAVSVAIEHELALGSAQGGVGAYTFIEVRFLACQLLIESCCHVIHRVLIERLQYHRTRLVGIVGCKVFCGHGVVHISFPESRQVALFIEFDELHGLTATLAEFAKFLEPWPQFVQQQLVPTLAFHNLWCFLHFGKFFFQRFVLGGRIFANAERCGFP